MPPEWARHLGCFLAWPHNRDTWPDKFDVIPPIYAEMVAKIARFDSIRLAVTDEKQINQVRETFLDAARRTAKDTPGTLRPIDIFHLPTNDAWVRDHGPIFVNRLASVAASTGPSQIALDWRFNSWGEKYGAFDLDDVVPQKLGARYGFKVIEPGIVLEGGSIDVNGAGSLLTTESCLLNPNRNPSLNRADIEDYLRTYLGVTNVLWLGDGIAGDDTDGHIDDLARFVAPDTIVTVVEDDPADVNYKVLQDNLERLRAMLDQNGRPFKIETLPMPPAVIHEDTRLPCLLRELLYRQRRSPYADLRRPNGRDRLRDTFPSFTRTPSSWRPLDRPGLGPRLCPLPEPATSRTFHHLSRPVPFTVPVPLPAREGVRFSLNS